MQNAFYPHPSDTVKQKIKGYMTSLSRHHIPLRFKNNYLRQYPENSVISSLFFSGYSLDIPIELK